MTKIIGSKLIIKGKEVVLNMAYKITDDCTMCDTCRSECPEEAISEADPKYVIDPEKCNDCGTCGEVCPVGACVPA